MLELDADSGKVLLTLSESHAILRYLARAYNCAEHWYPSTDIRKRSEIDLYLDEHHTYLRQGCGYLIFKMLHAERIKKVKVK